MYSCGCAAITTLPPPPPPPLLLASGGEPGKLRPLVMLRARVQVWAASAYLLLRLNHAAGVVPFLLHGAAHDAAEDVAQRQPEVFSE